MWFKACRRCKGDMYLEVVEGKRYRHCIQCSYETPENVEVFKAPTPLPVKGAREPRREGHQYRLALVVKP